MVASSILQAAAAPRPNIVLVVADDMSWADVGCYGNKDVKTPTLDALAQEGMRFTHRLVRQQAGHVPGTLG